MVLRLSDADEIAGGGTTALLECGGGLLCVGVELVGVELVGGADEDAGLELGGAEVAGVPDGCSVGRTNVGVDVGTSSAPT